MKNVCIAFASMIAASIATNAMALDGGTTSPYSQKPPEQIIVTGKRVNHTTDDSWIEDAYTNHATLGPRFAKGLMIWNNSNNAYGNGAAVPPPPFLEGFATRGWDVIRVQRNWRLGGADSALGFTRLAFDRDKMLNTISNEVRQAIADGYQRVILAGQGIGGALAMEVSELNPGVYGVIALAPNVGFTAGTGLGSQRGSTADDNNIGDTFNGDNANWAYETLAKFHPQRALVLFPQHDEQVPGLERGPKAKSILGSRTDLSYLLIDEKSGIYGHNGANSPAFLPIAACAEALMDPAFNPHPGQMTCGRDEVPTVLAELGVTPAPGRSWFGYSGTGVETYFEVPADNSAAVTFAMGRGALANQPVTVKQYAANRSADSVTFQIDRQETVTGLWKQDGLRMTVDAPDGSRSAVQMVPIN